MITSNFNSFFRDTNREIERLQVQQKQKAKEIVITAYSEVMQRSPVDKGNFKGNNLLTYNSKAPANQTRINPKAKEDNSMHSDDVISLHAIKWRTGDQIYIQNNLVYANKLEAGYSPQATGGVYGISSQIIKRKIREAGLNR